VNASLSSHANENLVMRDRELKSLRRQLDSVTEELTETSRSRDIALRENRRYVDDLSVMTKENQVCVDRHRCAVSCVDSSAALMLFPSFLIHQT